MLTLSGFAKAKGFTEAELQRFGISCSAGKIIVRYKTADGLEYIRYRIRDSSGEGEGFRWNRGTAELIPYGLDRPIPYNKGFVWVVEGESDCWALWGKEIPALGIPGAGNAKCLRAAHLEGVKKVAVVQEPGEAGERFPHAVAKRLYDEGFTGTVYAVVLPAKDPRALMVSANGTFRDELMQAFKSATPIPRPNPVASPQSRSISIAELFDAPIEETTWLVDGLLPAGGIGLLASPPKAGKSVFARNMALAVARGARFLDRRCEAGTVLWCAFEERQEDVVADFKSMGVDRTDPIRFHFGSSPIDAVAWINAECEAHKVSLLVLDTWHKFSLIENINNYAEVSRANEPLMKLSREKGVAQLWVHHTNKGLGQDGAQVLGSQSLFAACDSLLIISRAPDGVRTLRTIQRRGDDLEPTVLAMNDDKQIASAGGKFSHDVAKAEQQILDVLGPEQTSRVELMRRSALRRTLFYSALNSLIEKGLVERVGLGNRVSPFFYRNLPSPSGSRSSGDLKGTPGTTSGSGSQTSGTTWEPPEPREPQHPEQDDDMDSLLDYAADRIV